MKKLTCIFLAAVFVFVIAGCSTTNKKIGTSQSTKKSTKTKTTTGKKGKYKDGVYTTMHKSSKPGYEEAVVTIKGGKITNIVLKRLDNNKKEVNYNQWDGKHGDYPNLKDARINLANAMMKKQSADVAVITGATASSNGWKAAVSSDLAHAQ